MGVGTDEVLSPSYVASPGPVIALELNGDGVVEACKNIASQVFSGTKVSHAASLVHPFVPSLPTWTRFPEKKSYESLSLCRFLSPRTKTRPLKTSTASSTSLTCRWDYKCFWTAWTDWDFSIPQLSLHTTDVFQSALKDHLIMPLIKQSQVCARSYSERKKQNKNGRKPLKHWFQQVLWIFSFWMFLLLLAPVNVDFSCKFILFKASCWNISTKMRGKIFSSSCFSLELPVFVI